MTPTGMPRHPSARPYMPARDRVAQGAWLVGLGVFALLVASASVDGPGWFDPAERCALDSSGGVSSAAGGEFDKQERFFPPRVSCSLGGDVHAYQSEVRSWLTGLVLVAALACLVAGVVLLWRRARRILQPTPGGRARWHVPLMAVVGAVSTGVWAFVLLVALFTTETSWGWVAAGATCAVTVLPVLIHLDTVAGPPRHRLSTSWNWAMVMLGATAAGATTAALAAGASWLAPRQPSRVPPEDVSGS